MESPAFWIPLSSSPQAGRCMLDLPDAVGHDALCTLVPPATPCPLAAEARVDRW